MPPKTKTTDPTPEPETPTFQQGRALDDTEEAGLKRQVEKTPSPLIDMVRQAESDGKAYGVEVKADYPESTIYTHLKKAAEQIELKARNLKVKTWNKASGSNANAEWPHIAFKVVPIPQKQDDTPAES